MDTLRFFQTILPATGPYFGVLFHDKGKSHRSVATLEELAELVEKYKADPRVAVYHACASYQQPYVMVPHPRNPGTEKKAWRVAQNWGKAKSFWLDIDCTPAKAEAGEGYVDKQAGNVALSLFCSKVGLPRPMLVDSGNGLHAYWPLTKEIGPNSWRKLAEVLKLLTKELGFLVDPTRTADLSSILRPPGTFNRKGTEKAVVVRRECAAITPEDFKAAIAQAVDKFGVLAPKPYMDASINADVLAHVPEPAPSSAVLAASKCQQLAQVRDTQGDVPYDQWFGAIGIIVHSTEGRELAHEWSARRAETGHTTVDPDERFDSWNAGPTTCEKFSKANPAGCAGCEYSGKVKSPILLGRVVPEPAASEVKAEVDGETVTVEVPALPHGYEVDKKTGAMVRHLTDKDGIIHVFAFTPLTLYATHRVVNEAGSYGLALRAHLPRGRIREFVIDTSTLEASAELAKALGDKEIVTTSHEKARHHLTAYLKDSLHKLMTEADEINTLTSFGWHYDMQAFLLGDKLFHRDGTVRKVLVGGYAASVIDRAFGKSVGTVEGYARALNDIYARPGMEPYQYVIASAFGSLLTPLGEDTYNGLLLALTGNSGKGKSSACQAALYAFGDAKDGLTITGDKRVGATDTGRWGMLGAYKNIPLLFDETTKLEADDLSNMAYTVALGKDKQRGINTADGVRLAKQHTWRMSPLATANNDIHIALSGMQSNTEAEAVRIVQIRTERYNIPSLDEAEVPSALEQIRRNRGTAGELFIRHIVEHLPDVEDVWRHTMVEVTKLVPGAKFRFFRNHAACTLTALRITNELGITEFDYGVLFDFAVKLMQELSDEVETDNVQTPKDAFMRMVNELVPRTVITSEYRDGRDKAGPEDVPRINGTIAGRYISGNSSKPDAYAGHLYITKREFKGWCGTNRVSPTEIEHYLKNENAWLEVPAKFLFTRGTNLPMLQSPCIGVDMSRVSGVMIGGPKVVPAATDALDNGSTRANMGA